MSWLERVRDFFAYPDAPPEPAQSKAATFATLRLTDTEGWHLPTIWPQGGAVPLTGHTSATYAELYARQPWVYAVVNKLSHGIGRLPLKAYGTDDKGGRFRLRDAALATVLDAPYDRGSPTSLKQRIIGDLAIYGNALLYAGRDSEKRPASFLEPLHPDRWWIATDGTYRTRAANGEEVVAQPYNIVHFKFYRPDEGATNWGLSPLEPLRQTLLIEDAAQRLAAADFANGSKPSGGLFAESPMTQQSIDLLREQWNSLHQGPDSAGKTAVFGGVKWQPFSRNLNESAAIDHRRLTREEVCGVYDVPPTVVGILDKATFSNITEQGRWLVQHTFTPWTTLIEETIAAQLLRGVDAYAGQYVEFEFGEILRGALAERFTAYNQAINAGIFTQNEIRRLENYPPITDDPDADRLHRPGNLTPMLGASAPPIPTGGA